MIPVTFLLYLRMRTIHRDHGNAGNPVWLPVA
jgi:hypothetical protein